MTFENFKEYAHERLDEMEKEQTEAQEFAQEIQDAIQKIFPKSFVNVRLKKVLDTSIWGDFTLGSKEQWKSGIINNDPAHTTFKIDTVDKDGNLSEVLEFDYGTGNSLLVKPAPDSYMAFDSIKTGLRKKKGNKKQVMKHIVNHFTKLKKLLQKHKDDLAQPELIDNI